MINPKDWLRTRKNLLDEVKSQVRVRLGSPPASIRRYARALEGDFTGAWRPCPEKTLISALGAARVVLGADFHAYAQSQRAHVRILRDMVRRPRVILALECLEHGQEEIAADFLRGKISETKFLTAVDWDKRWGFPWENYRPLFELARDSDYEIQGLGQSGQSRLDIRDRWMANKLDRLMRENEDSLVYVVLGEMHLARKHLPRHLAKRQKLAATDVLVLFQDVESIYFRQARLRRESSADYLRGPGQRFCLMVSPPWMKWQSYLMYLEQTYDRDLQEDLAVDYTDHVASLIDLLEKDLRTSVNKSRIQVYCPSSRTSLTKLKMSLPKKTSRVLRYHLEHDISFYLPEREWLYLSRATINHASALAGQYMHAHFSGRRRVLWDLPADFLPLIWVEAVGFFFSKWINPKRKAETLEGIRLRLRAGRAPGEGQEALLLALDHRLSEVVYTQTGRVRPRGYRPRGVDAYIEASRIVGGMLGERLFQRVRSRTISLRQLMTYLKMNVEDKSFAQFYWDLIRRIETK